MSFLREQIERAKRYASAMTNTADRERFEQVAEGYQREIDAQSSAEPTGASVPTDTGASATTDAGNVTPPSSPSAATNEGDSTVSSENTGPRETD